MADQSSVALRTLGPRASLSGDASDSLAGINTRSLPDGALCWVSGVSARYGFRRASTEASDPPTVIAPIAGPGRWHVEDSGNSENDYIIRASLADLIARDSAAFRNGTAAFVIDENETYRLDTENTFAVAPPVLVLARGAGTGRWFRKSKAYVVGNYTLWCATYTSPTRGGICGFTAGQLLQSSTAPPDIVLDMHEQTNTLGNQEGVLVDGLGNLWLLVNGDNFLSIHFYKYLLEDCLESGAPPISITLDLPISAGGSEAAIAAFDRYNGLWAGCGQHGTFGKSRLVRYGVHAYGSSSGVPSIDIVVDPAAGSTSNQQDIVFDDNGNLWAPFGFSSAGFNGGVFMLTPAQQQANSASLEPEIYWTGTNFTGVGLGGTCQAAIAPNGLIWISDITTPQLRAWDMSLPSGNPAPSIVVTCPSFELTYSIAFDLEGNLWVTNNVTSVERIPASALVSSGVAVPDIVLEPGAQFGLGAKICFPNNRDRSGLLPAGFPPGQ